MNKIIKFGGLVAISGLATYLYLRKKNIDRLTESLEISIIDVNKFKLNINRLKADLYFKIHNPTLESLNVAAGGIVIKTLRVYDKKSKKQLALTDLNITNFKLDAKGSFYLPAVQISIPLITGAMLVLTQLNDNKADFMDRLYFEIDISVMNISKTITI